MTDQLSTFAAVAVMLYVAHHVGDYWIQSDHQARHKGQPGSAGRRACTAHVLTYVATQALFLTALIPLGIEDRAPTWRVLPALAVSGLTHWTADRRGHGLLFWLARRMPGKRNLLAMDAGHLASGAWALDQSWHLFWGVLVAALVVAI
jgi:hypothetical protein